MPQSQTKPQTIAICSQVYPPDPTAVGQHMSDLAQALAIKHEVTVYTARRGFANPNQKYPAYEVSNNVTIRRLPMASFGKTSMVKRIVGGLSFCTQCIGKLLLQKNLNTLLVSTSPPMGGLIGVVVKTFRPTTRVIYWVMDLNPDQWVRVGGVSPTHPLVKMQDALNRAIFNKADAIIVLDDYMFALCAAKTGPENCAKFIITPPWPHESVLEPVERTGNPFIDEHDLNDKQVLMFSGNLSPSSSISVVLEALLAKPREDVELLVIGGGDGRKEVESAIDRGLKNVRLLPYLPLDQIKYSLSAGDIHVVSVGEQVVGINHPCKIYGAMAVARPILAISPPQSHLVDIINAGKCGWVVPHDDVEQANAVLDDILSLSQEELDTIGMRGKNYLNSTLSQPILMHNVIDVIEEEQHAV